MPKTKGSFGPERPPPKSPGRPKLTEQQKREARLRRAAEFDYKKELAAYFPIATEQLGQALEKGEFKGGDRVRVYEAMRDTLHGKPAQTLQGPGGGPLVGSFTAILKMVDGSKPEKI